MTRLQRAPEQVNATLDDTVVVMKLSDSSYYELNPIATRIWEKLASPTDVEDLISNLLAEYDVDAATCRDEVGVWLQKMQQRGLVVAVD